jgi:hypothetical protein
VTQVRDVAHGPLVLINFANIEMKLGMNVCNKELQISLSFFIIDQYLAE